MIRRIILSIQAQAQLFYSSRYSFVVALKQQKKYAYKFQRGIGFKPHPNKIIYGGDDAYFADDNILAIADGVGSWNKDNVQPSYYSMKVIKFIQKIYKNQKKKTIEDPMYAAKQAIRLVKVLGTTTLSIITLHPETGDLKSYYIGDSVYGFFKKQQIQMATPQMISFNKPYQVGQMAHKVEDGYQNQYSYSHVKQDTIVIASDGIWDNMTLDRLHYEIKGPGSKFKNGIPKSLTQIAQNVVQLGYKLSFSSNYLSPIHKRAVEQGVKYPKEGKVDDITIIIANIARVQMLKGEKYF